MGTPVYLLCLLFCLQAVLPIAIGNQYRHVSKQNALCASHLLVLSEALKLLVTVCACWHHLRSSRGRTSTNGLLDNQQQHRSARSARFQQIWSHCTTSTDACAGGRVAALLAFAAACYTISNKWVQHDFNASSSQLYIAWRDKHAVWPPQTVCWLHLTAQWLHYLQTTLCRSCTGQQQTCSIHNMQTAA